MVSENRLWKSRKAKTASQLSHSLDYYEFLTGYGIRILRARSNAELPRGICEVSWNAASGSRVRLTIKTEDDKTLTVSARMVAGKQETTGVITSVINGVTYLKELHTKNARFVIRNRTEGSK